MARNDESKTYRERGIFSFNDMMEVRVLEGVCRVRHRYS